MSAVEELEAKLQTLRSEREALLVARTSESTAESAREFLVAARRQSERVGAHVVSVRAIGESLDDVIRSFVLSDPRLPDWLVEQAGEFAQTSEKEKAAGLRKLDAEITKAVAAVRERRKAQAIAAIENEFAGEAA